MSPAELTEAIARVRRAMPRNKDVMALCDAAEDMAGKLRLNEAKLPRKEYMRIYQQERRRKLRRQKDAKDGSKAARRNP